MKRIIEILNNPYNRIGMSFIFAATITTPYFNLQHSVAYLFAGLALFGAAIISAIYEVKFTPRQLGIILLIILLVSTFSITRHN